MVDTGYVRARGAHAAGWRWGLRVGLLVGLIGIVLSSRATLRAGNGDVLSISTVLAGKELTDIAFDSSANPPGGSFWVVTRMDGKIRKLTTSLNQVLAEIPNPHGIGSIPNFVLTWGIAYRPTSGTLFVLAQGTGKWWLREVRTDGQPVGDAIEVVPPRPATAALRGLTFDSETQSLWYLDANNEQAVRMDLAGVTQAEFRLPSPTETDTILRGEGICFELEKVGATFEPRIYATYGDVFRTRPTRILQLTAAGEPTGVEVPILNLPFESPQGIQTYRVGATLRRVIVVSAQGSIATVEQTIPSPVPPSGLVGSLTPSNKVELAWRNNGSGPSREYGGSITVLRRGVPFATIDGASVSFLDATPLEGYSQYSLKAVDVPGGPTSPESFPCEVTVGMGGVIRWTPFGGSRIHDVTVDPSNGDVFATDSLGVNSRGRILHYDSELRLLGEIHSPFEKSGGVAFVTSIQLDTVTLENVLAVARQDGVLVSLMDLQGTIKKTFPLDFKTIGGPQIGGLTYIPHRQQFACLELTTHQIVVNDENGRWVESCTPPDVPFSLPDLDAGLTYDPIRDRYVTTFVDGWARELYTGGCTLGDYEFSLESLGEGFDETGFVGGIQISENTLLVAGKRSNAIFQVLIFPFSPNFTRGDFDGNGTVNLTDAVALASYLFQGGLAPGCQDAADSNDDAVLDVSDPVYLLFHLFLQGPPPPAPFPNPGLDPTFRDNLGCDE